MTVEIHDKLIVLLAEVDELKSKEAQQIRENPSFGADRAIRDRSQPLQ
jgi:hypothetical protein